MAIDNEVIKLKFALINKYGGVSAYNDKVKGGSNDGGSFLHSVIEPHKEIYEHFLDHKNAYIKEVKKTRLNTEFQTWEDIRNFRIMNEKDEVDLAKMDKELADLRAKREAFLKEHFIEWELLTKERALELGAKLQTTEELNLNAESRIADYKKRGYKIKKE